MSKRRLTSREAQAGMCKFVRAVETLGTLVQAEVNLARLRQRARQNKKRYLEQKNGAVMNEDTDAVAGVDFNEHPRDLAEDVEDVDDFIAKPHVHDRFAKVNMDSLKGLTTARGVARLARSALNDSDWGSTTRSKVGAALVFLANAHHAAKELRRRRAAPNAQSGKDSTRS